MTVIDVHAHLLVREGLHAVRELIPEMGPELVGDGDSYYLEFSTGRRTGPFPRALFDVDRRIADMDDWGIDVQVVCAPPSNFGYELEPGAGALFAQIQNDAMLDVVSARADRLCLLATLPLQDPAAAVAEIERVAPNRLVRGVTIGTSVAGRDLDDPELAPVWAALEAADLPALVHPDQAAAPGGERLARYYLQNLVGNPLETTLAIASVVFGGVLARNPGLRLLFVHGGGFAPYQLGRWDHGWSMRAEPKVLIDRPPSRYIADLYFDSVTFDGSSLRFLLDRAGDGRVLFGSDYPFDMSVAEPVAALRLAIDDPRLRRALTNDNIAAFLRPEDR
jgi:aminocarboxymuconate-semialdehyde decarboxylase